MEVQYPLKTAYEICEMKKKLEKEKVYASRNQEVGKYVEIFIQTEEGVSCMTGISNLDVALDFFQVRAVQWTGLENLFKDAGYEIRKTPTIVK